MQDLNFHPKIALITRTLQNAFSDLVHFMILFLLVTIAYAMAGVVLFGHQFEGYATITDAIFLNLGIVMCWGLPWIQVSSFFCFSWDIIDPQFSISDEARSP